MNPLLNAIRTAINWGRVHRLDDATLARLFQTWSGLGCGRGTMTVHLRAADRDLVVTALGELQRHRAVYEASRQDPANRSADLGTLEALADSSPSREEFLRQCEAYWYARPLPRP